MCSGCPRNHFVSIPFKRERAPQGAQSKRSDRLRLEVSIPFKRERASQVDDIIPGEGIIIDKFPFPSNGNAHPKEDKWYERQVAVIQFPFPSNGNAQGKGYTHE